MDTPKWRQSEELVDMCDLFITSYVAARHNQEVQDGDQGDDDDSDDDDSDVDPNRRVVSANLRIGT